MAWCVLAAVLALASCTAGAASPAHHAVPVGTVPPTAVKVWAPALSSDGPALKPTFAPTPTIALPAAATPSTAATEAPHIAEQDAEPEPSTPIPQTILPTPPQWSGSVLSRGEVRSLFVATGWPAAAIDRGVEMVFGTASCPNGESGGDPSAVSPGGDWGLLQIHAATWMGYFGVADPSVWLDPARNLTDALVIYGLAGGWSPWSCSR